jgi:hypothetical protein
MLDPAKFASVIDEVAALDITVVAGGHTPALRGARLQEAFTLLRDLPRLPEADLPGQADLDAILSARAQLAA